MLGEDLPMNRAQTSQEGQRRRGRRPPLVPHRPRLGGLLVRRPRPAGNLPQDTIQLGLDQLRHQTLALIHHFSVIYLALNYLNFVINSFRMPLRFKCSY